MKNELIADMERHGGNKVKMFNSFFLMDGYRYTTNRLSLLKIFFSNPEYRFLVFFRICKRYKKSNIIGLFFRILLNLTKARFGIQIPINTSIAKGFKLNHFGSIVINQGVIIGENCNVSQGVTLGNVSRGKLKGCPTIGDRVWIGANSVVVGKITIGNDVLIAPLSYVNFDVPDNAVVMGNPASIVNYNGSGGYIKNI
jgi:serine O-acetyltransferase